MVLNQRFFASAPLQGKQIALFAALVLTICFSTAAKAQVTVAPASGGVSSGATGGSIAPTDAGSAPLGSPIRPVIPRAVVQNTPALSSTSPTPDAGKAVGADKNSTQSRGLGDSNANNDSDKSDLVNQAEATRKIQADQNEFQRFVAQNSGKMLPLFGYGLFSQPNRYAPVMSAPVPSTYILGPGDELVLQTYGVADVSERLVIDRNGRVSIPKVGQVTLAGVAFSEAEKVLNASISKVYTNYTLSLAMGRLRSIEIFVLGQAAQPGKQVVSGLSTLINALFETGGANSNGSLRQIELRRGGKTITTVDLYKFLANGDNSSDMRLQSGDVIFIPPAGERAALLGTVNAPAIYELRKDESISDVLALSGGLPVLAAPQRAQLERIDSQKAIARYVEDFELNSAGLQRKLKAGDMLTVFQVSPQIANVVTLEGNVASPMRYTFKSGMRVSDILSDPRLLIPTSYWLGINSGANSSAPNRPEVNLDYATIQRLDPKGVSTRLLSFSPAKAMGGDKLENLELQSGDIVVVYGPNQAGPETDDSIAIAGEIVGGLKRFPWRSGMTLKELIPNTQWLIDYYQYWQKASGQSIRNDINWDYAKITRRIPQALVTESIEFNLGQQVLLDIKNPQFKPLLLQPGDQINLYTSAQVQMPLEKRIQFITIRGEVKVPGVYQLKAGETLWQIIERAGGFTNNSYVYGTVFTRESTRVQQQNNIEAATRRMEAQISSQANTMAQNQTNADGLALQAQLAAQRQMLERMRGLKASGRIALDLDFARPRLPSLILEDGDSITIPHQPNFVGVYGAVLSETSFIHKSAYTVADYIERAGATREADLDAALLVRADGTVLVNSAHKSWWGLGNRSFLSTNVNPGDSIFLPEVLDRRTAYNKFIQDAKDWTQIIYQFGLGIAAYRSLK